jgi:hypothetical protein
LVLFFGFEGLLCAMPASVSISSSVLAQALVLYRVLVATLPVLPDLSLVQKPTPCPDAWPVVVASFQWKRKQLVGFVVTDGVRAVSCRGLSEVYDRVLALGEGAIVHLFEAHPVFLPEEKGYGLDVGGVITLKEYDEQLKQEQHRQERKERWAKNQLALALRSQGYLEESESLEFQEGLDALDDKAVDG